MVYVIYAVKAVDGKEVNKVLINWTECKSLVLGHNAVYKSFKDDEEADADAFLRETRIHTSALGEGYAPVSMDTTLIYGRFLFNRYRSETYSVSVFKTKRGKVACKGAILPDNEHLLYALSGYYEKDKTYGYQFIVTSYKEHITDSKDSIMAYLSCGILKGIGPKRAEAIYHLFGENTMEVLEKYPERLLRVKGITERKLKDIKESYEESKASREIVSYLLSFGISQKYGVRLYQQYKSFAMSKLTENPYILCMQKGLTFLDADRVAKALKFPLKSPLRFKYACFHVLKNKESYGDTGMELQKFGYDLYDLLKIDGYTKEEINNDVCDLVHSGDLKILRLPEMEGQYVFTQTMYRKEEELAELMCSISCEPADTKEAEKLLDYIACTDRINLGKDQKNAILTSLTYPLTVIDGGPGTGKTTDINYIQKVHKELFPDMEIIFLAPTGRAARRITESTGCNAHTIHSYLHLTRDAKIDENEVLFNDALIIVDEFSMVDIHVAYMLFHAVAKNCRMVLVGDTDQLPSIGPGSVLRDVIKSGAFPVSNLKKIYRTGKDTQIYANAKRIKDTDPELKESNDYKIFDCNSMEDVRNMMVERVVALTQKYGLGNVMCLCPYWEHTAGINDMNALLQEKFNPPASNKIEVKHKGFVFREGDYVMQIHVNTEDASNGDVGFITKIIFNEESPQIYVNMNKKEICYEKDDLDLLVHAYATSVHKSQGSEAKACVFTLMPFHRGMLYYNIPYVAVSRGKQEVDFCGSRQAMKDAILNREKGVRISALRYFLMRASGQFINM